MKTTNSTNRLIPTAIVLSDGTTHLWSEFKKVVDHEGLKLSLEDGSSIHVARISTMKKLMDRVPAKEQAS